MAGQVAGGAAVYRSIRAATLPQSLLDSPERPQDFNRRRSQSLPPPSWESPSAKASETGGRRTVSAPQLSVHPSPPPSPPLPTANNSIAAMRRAQQDAPGHACLYLSDLNNIYTNEELWEVLRDAVSHLECVVLVRRTEKPGQTVRVFAHVQFNTSRDASVAFPVFKKLRRTLGRPVFVGYGRGHIILAINEYGRPDYRQAAALLMDHASPADIAKTYLAPPDQYVRSATRPCAVVEFHTVGSCGKAWESLKSGQRGRPECLVYGGYTFVRA